jgi:hypothetical protein
MFGFTARNAAAVATQAAAAASLEADKAKRVTVRAQAIAKREADCVFKLEQARAYLAKCDAALARWHPSNLMHATLTLQRVDWARQVAELEVGAR